MDGVRRMRHTSRILLLDGCLFRVGLIPGMITSMLMRMLDGGMYRRTAF
jgi:hypothetical protein